MSAPYDKAAQVEFLKGTERAPEHLLRDWTERLASGERGKKADGLARAVIRDFALRQWLGHPHSPATLEWLADVLSAVLDHGKPLDALGLMPRPASRPANPRIAIDVALWLKATEDRGYDAADAVALAAERFAKDPKSIERYRTAAADWVAARDPSADWAAFFGGRWPLPPVKDRK
jgi:hypothetical protein